MAFTEASLGNNKHETIKRVLYRSINCSPPHPLHSGHFNFPHLLASPTLSAKSRLFRNVKTLLSIFNIEFGKLVFWIASNVFFSSSCFYFRCQEQRILSFNGIKNGNLDKNTLPFPLPLFHGKHLFPNLLCPTLALKVETWEGKLT